MAVKKATLGKMKGKASTKGRERRASGATRVEEGDDPSLTARGSANGKNGRPPRRKSGPAALPEDSEDAQKARELTLRVWESIYAKRDKLRNLYWVK